MKRMASLIFAVIMAASFSGCGENNNESSADENSTSSQAGSTDESMPVPLGGDSSVQSRSQQSNPQQTSKASNPDKSTVYAAYGSVVDGLINQHGRAEIVNDRSTIRGTIKGVSVVRVIDLNRDGIAELICAYNGQGMGSADTQEIYTFSNGSAVSIYKGGINYEDETTDKPFVEYYTAEEGTYVLTNGSDMTYYDGKDMVVVSDVRPGRDKAVHLGIYSSDNADKVIKDTLETMKNIGIPSANNQTTDIKNTEEYKEAFNTYKGFIDSRKWASYEYDGKKINDRRLIAKNSVIFDYNGDGIFELYLETVHNYDDYDYENETENDSNDQFYSYEPSYLYTIEDGKVKQLLQEVLVSNDTGGTRVRFAYSEADDTVYITEWGNVFQYQENGSVTDQHLDIYTMEGTALSDKLKAFSSVTKYDPEKEQENVSYTIDEETAKKADYEKAYNAYKFIDSDKLDQYFNGKSSLSNSERLKELDALLGSQ